MARFSQHHAILTMPQTLGVRHLFRLYGILSTLLCGLAFVVRARGIPNLSLAALWLILSGRNDDALRDAGVLGIRLPRLILSFLIGADLGVTGVLLQDLLRNGLVGPELLGVLAGAAVAIATMVVAYVITITSLGCRGDFSSILLFLHGTVVGRGWAYVELFLSWALIGTPLALFCARPLNLLGLGDELAEGLGLLIFWARLGMLILAAAMVAAVVAVCGPISFIALLAPHLNRRLLAIRDARRVLPGAVLVGATLLVGADHLAGHLLFESVELPVGLWTTLIAVPLLLALLRREHGRTTGVTTFDAISSRLPFAPVLLLSLVSVCVLILLHIAVGRVALSPVQVAAALLQTPREPFHQQIVWEVRLPRALIALIAG